MAKTSQPRPILFVRAGATAWDEAGRLGGACDLPLCPTGEAQVRTALEQIEGQAIAAVISGPDEASVSTAKLFAESAGVKAKVFDGLHELDLGLWQGLLPTELEDKCPTAYRQWKDDPEAVSAPEGESVAEAQERIIGALAKALDRVSENGRPVVVILKPMALALVRCWLDGHPLARVWDVVEESCGTQWREVPRSLLDARREGSREAAGRAGVPLGQKGTP